LNEGSKSSQKMAAPMKKEELFRQHLLCFVEEDEYNMIIAKGVISKLGLEDEYLRWQSSRESGLKRFKPFPKDEILGMLD